MSTMNDAANDLRKLGLHLKGIIGLADELTRIGSLENAASEAEFRAEKAKKREAEISSGLAAAEKELATCKKNAADIIKDAHALADKTVDLAKAAAAEMKAKAQADANQIVDSAKKLKADIDAIALQRKAEADSLQATIITRSEKVAELDKQMAALRAKLS